MCDGKAVFDGTPKEGGECQEKGSPNFHKAGPPYKSWYINTVGKVRRLIHQPKFL